MTETTTRNARLAELAALAHEFLTHYAGMPDIAAVKFDVWETRPIALQLVGPEITALATWARELGTTVRMVDHGNYIHCAARTDTYGEAIELWDHLRPLEAYKLLGFEVPEKGVDVDPDQLLAASTREG